VSNKAPFVIDPHLTGIAIAYQNGDLIARSVLPDIYVPQKEYKYTLYPIGEEFQLPDTLVGRRGKAAPASPENFDPEVGKRYAYEDAFRELWPLEGYVLCTKLHEQAIAEEKTRRANPEPDGA
jgi:hypothetical protein